MDKESLKEIKLILKAILTVQLRENFSNEKNELNKAEAARFLHSVGFQPSDIALLLGKKKATEIAPYLHKKKR